MKPASRTVAAIALAVILFVIIIAIVAFVMRPARVRPATAPSAARTSIDYTLPPLPAVDYVSPRPMTTVREAYRFAADHPEILSYVPCFCGCERAGHTSNERCFVARRDAVGRVVEWDTHGLS